VVISSYQERFDFRAAFDLVGKGRRVKDSGAKTFLGKNSMGTVPTRPATNQVLRPRIFRSMSH